MKYTRGSFNTLWKYLYICIRGMYIELEDKKQVQMLGHGDNE